MPLRAMRSQSHPNTPPTVFPNASAKPISTHCTPITAIATKLIIMVVSTFFRRTMPP